MSAAKLQGKHAFVTGGGSGIGAVIALALAERGVIVTIAGRRQAPLELLAHHLLAPDEADRRQQATDQLVRTELD